MSRIIKSQQAHQEKGKKIAIKVRTFDFLQNENADEGINLQHFQSDQFQRDAKQEAERLLLDAKQKAQAIAAEIQQDREHWENQEKVMFIEQAQKEGYQQGVEDGFQKGYNEIAGDIAFAKEVVESSKKDYRQHIESTETVILNLAVKVAEKIIGHQLEKDEESFLSIVKRAIKEARDYREVQLHIHPVQYQSILSHKEELIAIFPKDTELYIFPDDEIEENSCIIESENGRTDASVNSQLQEIKVKLTELLWEGSNDEN
ncbi:flagellar assembly protein FliH [Peribacillus simplex]|uniref:flagellar assembly protein FliH n=1 Tax=Peribacillus simplex TaxID=1478 RepID=UPI0025A08A01|nr:flagellar assembly protein FliH [Peribacillus simplex]MDM5295455.1 flagellar assembly protein FliH [Peribacillus simplex]